MNRIPMSPAASAVLRTLVARSGDARDRILLSDVRSVDWQSLTFSGERHQIQLRVPRPNSSEVVDRMCTGLEEAEFVISGLIVADVGVTRTSGPALDGSTSVTIEALTVFTD